MKKNLLYLLMVAVLSFSLSSCDSSKNKYESLSMEVPSTFAAVEAAGASTMTPERFSNHFIGADFEKIQTQRTEDGVASVYSLKKNGKVSLSDVEDFSCCALFDYERNPNELTISSIAMRYTASSSEDADSFYSSAMSKLEPLMKNWGFELNEKLQKPNFDYYLKGNEVITVDKGNQEITITRYFR